MWLAYPFHVDRSGRTAEVDTPTHVRDLIAQLLFTAPGERVMRPDLGSGVAQLVFAPNAMDLAGATQILVQGALQRWLGELIAVLAVSIEAIDTELRVTIQYELRRDGRQFTETFTHASGAAA